MILFLFPLIKNTKRAAPSDAALSPRNRERHGPTVEVGGPPEAVIEVVDAGVVTLFCEDGTSEGIGVVTTELLDDGTGEELATGNGGAGSELEGRALVVLAGAFVAEGDCFTGTYRYSMTSFVTTSMTGGTERVSRTGATVVTVVVTAA